MSPRITQIYAARRRRSIIDAPAISTNVTPDGSGAETAKNVA
jgi:hypothetical protein